MRVQDPTGRLVHAVSCGRGPSVAAAQRHARMVAGMRKGKKGFNPDARAVPAKAQLFQAAAVLACVALSAYVGIGWWEGQFQRQSLPSVELGVALALPPLFPCFISWLMMFRDEIEVHDGAHMGAVALLAAAGHVTLALPLGLEGPGALLLAAAYAALAARNAKGLRVAWLKQTVPRTRVTEWAVAYGCGGAILAVLTLGHIRHGYGLLTAAAVALLYAAVTACVLVSRMSTFAERFPRVNSGEMWWAVVVLAAAEAARGARLALAHDAQVLASGGACVLFATGLSVAGVAAYRRTILRSKYSL